MKILNICKAIIKDPKNILYFLDRIGIYRMKDDEYIKLQYKMILNKELNLDNPQTYNEKLQWLKLNDKKDIYTTMVDKYEGKKYIANIIGEEYIIPTLGIYDKFDDINFNSLPNQFVIKCTHDSGGVIICKDKNKFDINNAKKKIEKNLKQNFYYQSREWPYKNVKPRIIIEKYIGTNDSIPEDYKFFVFNNEIDSVMLCRGREYGYPKFYFYDMNWNRLNYLYDEPPEDSDIQKPENFDVMQSIVKKLSRGFKQIRIDLYNINGQVYCGEITFYNQSGYDIDITSKTDIMWGKKLIL